MTEHCTLKTIKEGILDAMMRFTDTYHAYTATHLSAQLPLALTSRPGRYARQEVPGGNCEVCALGTLLCSSLSTTGPLSPSIIGNKAFTNWDYIPAHLQCFDAKTLAILEAIYEASSPRGRSTDSSSADELEEAWGASEHCDNDFEEADDEEPTGPLLAGMAVFSFDQRLLAALQYLYEQDGKLELADIPRFGSEDFTRALVSRGYAAANKAAGLYLQSLTDSHERELAQKALQENQ